MGALVFCSGPTAKTAEFDGSYDVLLSSWACCTFIFRCRPATVRRENRLSGWIEKGSAGHAEAIESLTASPADPLSRQNPRRITRSVTEDGVKETFHFFRYPNPSPSVYFPYPNFTPPTTNVIPTRPQRSLADTATQMPVAPPRAVGLLIKNKNREKSQMSTVKVPEKG